MEFRYLLAALIFIVSLTDYSFGRGGSRGGGGGGSRGGGGGVRSSGSLSKGSRSKGGSRGSSSGSRIGKVKSAGGRYRSTISRAKYSGVRSALAAGTIVRTGSRYNTRYYDLDEYEEDLRVCYSKSFMVEQEANGTNTVRKEYFVCPFDESDDLEAKYCCGYADQQRCCTYWKSGGRMAGVILGAILAGILLCIILWYGWTKCGTTKKNISGGKGVRLTDVKNSQDEEAEPMAP